MSWVLSGWKALSSAEQETSRWPFQEGPGGRCEGRRYGGLLWSSGPWLGCSPGKRIPGPLARRSLESEHSPTPPSRRGAWQCLFHASVTSTPLNLPWRDNGHLSQFCHLSLSRGHQPRKQLLYLKRGFLPQGLCISRSPQNARAPLVSQYFSKRCSPERLRGSRHGQACVSVAHPLPGTTPKRRAQN